MALIISRSYIAVLQRELAKEMDKLIGAAIEEHNAISG
jgi:hypothetical protein